MGLFDLFRQRDPDSRGAAAPAAAAVNEPIEAARTRARRRLIGAVVLLGVGIVAFPILFETQPRPIPVDIPIQIPSRDNAAPLVLPPPRTAASRPAAAAAASAPPPAVVAEAPREPAPAAAPAPAPVVAAPPPKAEAAAPKAQPAPAPVAAAALAKPEAGGRFVVQVGAFAESSAVREARAKVEKLGLATYTQVVETSGGARTRVRVGPFSTREEADKAAGRVKAAGLQAAVLTL